MWDTRMLVQGFWHSVNPLMVRLAEVLRAGKENSHLEFVLPYEDKDLSPL